VGIACQKCTNSSVDGGLYNMSASAPRYDLNVGQRLNFEDLGSRMEPVRGLIRDEWSQHRNPDGSLGGWVKNTAFVDPTAFVGPGALVVDKARVLNRSRICDSACVAGWSIISGNAVVSEHAQVTDTAHVGGDCLLNGDVVVRGSTELLSGSYSSGIIRASLRATGKGVSKSKA
jgi:carbonic anhydrase/acetyltransferase-like protein (isoleucine patch superfamily)